MTSDPLGVGLHHGVPMADYLSHPAWSCSDLSKMLESPEACNYYRTALDKPSPAKSFGTLAHTALLEPESWPPEDVVWVDGPMNRNPWKKQKDDAVKAGKRVERRSTFDRIDALVSRAYENPLFRSLLNNSEGHREVVAIAECPETGLLLKARCDARVPEQRIIGDVKTTGKGTDPSSFANSLWNNGWWMSAAHYMDVFSITTGEKQKHYVYAVIGQDAPYLPRVYTLDPLTLETAYANNIDLRRSVAKCVEDGTWPPPSEKVEPIGLSRWRLNEMRERVGLERV